MLQLSWYRWTVLESLSVLVRHWVIWWQSLSSWKNLAFYQELKWRGWLLSIQVSIHVYIVIYVRFGKKIPSYHCHNYVWISTVTCASECVHGECTDRDTCTCDKGWTGSTCDKEQQGKLSTSHWYLVHDDVCYDASHYRSAREYSKHWIDCGSGDRSSSVYCSFYCGYDNHNQQIQATQEEKRRVSQLIKSIVILCSDTISSLTWWWMYVEMFLGITEQKVKREAEKTDFHRELNSGLESSALTTELWFPGKCQCLWVVCEVWESSLEVPWQYKRGWEGQFYSSGSHFSLLSLHFLAYNSNKASLHYILIEISVTQ